LLLLLLVRLVDVACVCCVQTSL